MGLFVFFFAFVAYHYLNFHINLEGLTRCATAHVVLTTMVLVRKKTKQNSDKWGFNESPCLKC